MGYLMNKAVNIKSGKVVFMSEEYQKANSDKYKEWKKPVVKRKAKAKVETKVDVKEA